MVKVRLPNSPTQYDREDQDRLRRLLEASFDSIKLEIAGGGTGVLSIKSGDAVFAAGIGTLDFASADFSLTESPTGEVNVAISSGISRVGHVHDAADVTTGIFARARLPAQVAYEDEANTFTLAQMFGAGPTYSPVFTAQIVAALNNVGSANARIATIGRNIANTADVVGIFASEGGLDSVVLGAFSNHSVRFRVNNVDTLRLTSAALVPETVGLITLGHPTERWGKLWGQDADFNSLVQIIRSGGGANDYLHLRDSTDTNDVIFHYDGGSWGLHSESGGTGSEYLTFVDATKVRTGLDFEIGSLGRFDSTDTPSDLQLLVYHAGTINKWQAENIQFVRGGGDFHAALLADNTAIAYVLLDPGSGSDTVPGNPPAPATPTVTVGHKAFVLDVAGYVKPADFRYFEWEHCTGASCSGWGALAFTTSHTIVHSRLTTSDVKRYRVRAVDRAGNVSAFATTGDNTVVAQSDTQAFAGVIAGEIATVDLTALAGDIGILVTGQMRGSGNTYGINFGGVGGIPAGWVAGINFENTSLPGGMVTYVNFHNGGSAGGTFIKHARLQMDYNGDVLMYQTSSQPMFKLTSSDFLLQNDNSSPTQGLLIDGSLPGGWTRYFNLNGSGSMVKHDKLELNYDGSIKMIKFVIFLTSGTSWTVPSDFNPFLNSIELIGAGGAGAGGVADTRSGGGGGGGEYRRLVGFNPGSASSITYAIGAGGAGAGGNTSWDSGTVVANGGGAASGATGGAAGTGGSGGEGRAGGVGGAGSSGTGNRGGGGGGGAAGPNGGGFNLNGLPGSGSAGGAGGPGGPPNGGAGGAGGGGAGGNGTGWTANPGGSTAGTGGGGGGGFTGAGGTPGNYGAGGGGGGSTALAGNAGANGKQGIIVITYFPIGAL